MENNKIKIISTLGEFKELVKDMDDDTKLYIKNYFDDGWDRDVEIELRIKDKEISLS